MTDYMTKRCIAMVLLFCRFPPGPGPGPSPGPSPGTGPGPVPGPGPVAVAVPVPVPVPIQPCPESAPLPPQVVGQVI